jgi:DNA-binding MarR family transcriptional regulator
MKISFKRRGEDQKDGQIMPAATQRPSLQNKRPSNCRIIIELMPRKTITHNATVAAPALDTRYLEGLLGYNARRAALAIIEVFLQRMQVYELRPVDFSVLSVIAHNPGVTSRQLCVALGILPPNFVNLLASLEKRALVQRQPHPSDKRAIGLQLTVQGNQLMLAAEQIARQLEDDAAARLSATERKTLIRLLKKIYLPPTQKQAQS